MKVGDIVRIRNSEKGEEFIVKVIEKIGETRMFQFRFLLIIRNDRNIGYKVQSEDGTLDSDVITKDITKREEDLIMAQLI